MEESSRWEVPVERAGAAGWAPLVLRWALAAVFLAHGIQKPLAYGWSGGVASFAAWGIPWPAVSYPATVGIEVGAGLLLCVGLWVRAAGAALAIVMAVALFAVHLPHGFFLPDGIEFVLVLGAASASLALLGPGAWALERRLPGISLERWLANR